MYMNFLVKIPVGENGITIKNIKGTTYVYYAYERKYDPDKKYSVPKTTSIGKRDDEHPDMMFPNANCMKFFPDIEMPDEFEEDEARSSCLHVGAFFVIRKINAGYHLDEMVNRLFGKDAGLFLDLATYSILTENNAGQYYPDYAYRHPLFTKGMHIYNDSKVSSFLGQDMTDARIAFLNEWNAGRDHRQKIYVSYDSSNKHCQAGDIDLAEVGHEKDKQDKPIFNYAIAYDRNNNEPLFYEDYSGSINDVSQLQYMLEKVEGYGYRNIGFILDRGYFSETNIHYMDRHGYGFVIMVKGMKDLVSDLVLKHRGSFEQSRDASEKLFRGDKSYMGGRAERVYGNESLETKFFIEFIALIIRNKIYTCIKDEVKESGQKEDYMTVPAALKELEKIEMIKSSDRTYRIDHAVSATQKTILKAFGMNAADIKTMGKALSDDLKNANTTNGAKED